MSWGRTTIFAIVVCVTQFAAGCSTSSCNGVLGEEWPSEVVFAPLPREFPDERKADAERFAAYMEDQIGVDAEVSIPRSYADAVEALRSGETDVAYFGPWPYRVASEQTELEILLVVKRAGAPHFRSKWFVRDDSDITSPADLGGKDIGFYSLTSSGSYVFPLAEIVRLGGLETGEAPLNFFSKVSGTAGYRQTLVSLIEGEVDTAIAPAHAPQRYLSDEQRGKIRSIATLGPIPTHIVAVRPDLPEGLKKRLRTAFKNLAASDEGHMLQRLYGAESFMAPDSEEAHLSALDDALRTVGTDRDMEHFNARIEYVSPD
jgi:phosphonate transport system substrate-binding protein